MAQSYSRVITYAPQDLEAGATSQAKEDEFYSYQFAERTVRLGFVRKVFGLLAAQLAVTAVVTAAFVFSPGVKGFVATNPWLLATAFAGSLGLLVFMACSESARRTHPTNLICLSAFTLCEAVLVGAASATYDTHLVLIAAGMTAAITAGLATYAMQTKRDFTTSYGLMFTLLCTLILGGLLASIFRSQALSILVSAAGAALFAGYIVVDVQLMMGNGAMELSPDDYIFAALNIYLDILNLFLYLLRILQQIQGSR